LTGGQHKKCYTVQLKAVYLGMCIFESLFALYFVSCQVVQFDVFNEHVYSPQKADTE